MLRSIARGSVATFTQRPLLARSFSSASSSSPAATAPASLRIIHSRVHNPFFNIALESRMLTQIVEASTAAAAASSSSVASSSAATAAASPPAPAANTLFLWSNNPCVILGRHQNPHREVRLDVLRARDVALVRRQSGGGAVYQDRGNAIFSFISRDTPEQKEAHNAILLRTLASLGVQARLSGRNDMETAEGRKISGCAFKREKGWLLHHGTMLISVDMDALPALLSPSKAKLKAKGVESVAARVVNLQTMLPELTTDKWNAALEQSFREWHREQAAKAGSVAPSVETQSIDDASVALRADPLLQSSFDQLQSWDWIHGSTPEFTHDFARRFERWGSVDVGFQVAKGSRIVAAKTFSDALVPAMIDRVNAALATLVGQPYTREIVGAALDKAAAECALGINEEAAANVREMKEWLMTQL